MLIRRCLNTYSVNNQRLISQLWFFLGFTSLLDEVLKWQAFFRTLMPQILICVADRNQV